MHTSLLQPFSHNNDTLHLFCVCVYVIPKWRERKENVFNLRAFDRNLMLLEVNALETITQRYNFELFCVNKMASVFEGIFRAEH